MKPYLTHRSNSVCQAVAAAALSAQQLRTGAAGGDSFGEGEYSSTGAEFCLAPALLAAVGCSLQHPSQAFPHPQVPSGQAQRPPQHSSFGKVTRPKASARSVALRAASGYTMTFIVSSSTPTPILRFAGGAGRAAARAKKRSRIFAAEEEAGLGNATPAVWSTQVPQPSTQFLRSLEA